MVFRPATLCCFLLIVALATSAKIPPKNKHRCSKEENREKSFGYSLDSVPHSNELFLDESVRDYLDDFSDDSLDWKEEDPEKNSKNLFEYLLKILSFEVKLEELMTNDKKIPSQEVSVVTMSGSGEDPDDDYWEDEDPIEELVIDEMHPVVTTTTEPPTTTEAVVTTMITANENQLSGSFAELPDYFGFWRPMELVRHHPRSPKFAVLQLKKSYVSCIENTRTSIYAHYPDLRKYKINGKHKLISSLSYLDEWITDPDQLLSICRSLFRLRL